MISQSQQPVALGAPGLEMPGRTLGLSAGMDLAYMAFWIFYTPTSSFIWECSSGPVRRIIFGYFKPFTWRWFEVPPSSLRYKEQRIIILYLYFFYNVHNFTGLCPLPGGASQALLTHKLFRTSLLPVYFCYQCIFFFFLYFSLLRQDDRYRMDCSAISVPQMVFPSPLFLYVPNFVCFFGWCKYTYIYIYIYSAHKQHDVFRKCSRMIP